MVGSVLAQLTHLISVLNMLKISKGKQNTHAIAMHKKKGRDLLLNKTSYLKISFRKFLQETISELCDQEKKKKERNRGDVPAYV